MNCGATSTSSASAVASSGTLLDRFGTGAKTSDPSSLPGGVVQVCWDVSKRSASAGNPDVTFFIRRVSDHEDVQTIGVHKEESNCAPVTLDAGTYEIVMGGISQGRWHLTIQAS